MLIHVIAFFKNKNRQICDMRNIIYIWKCTCEKTKMGLNTLLGPTLTSLVFCLIIFYFKIFQKYPKDIPFVSLTKN
jgi:hypothetical protein